MIQIYTTPSCASCRKAKKWFDQYKIPYSEKNIFSIKLSKEDIYKMLANSENGFEDIISTRSKVFKEKKLDPESMSVQALVEFIIDNPSVLKRPIIINESELQVGYNNEDITIFLPKELRNIESFYDFTKIDGESEDEESE
ncbi:MAG: transcriptional regulator Spx [Bacilli bacterium]|nr:transcriptional regulator Spx [Bacilli bacterium]MDD7314736.1 transcriptional regulator Spx [Bacilli bacterium]MDY4052126.1 transcriptional regulator Spx [Bacilli bacterium]